jgi:hypothetical protein
MAVITPSKQEIRLDNIYNLDPISQKCIATLSQRAFG